MKCPGADIARAVTTFAALTAIAVASAPVRATPADGVTGTTSARITIGDTDYVLRQITIAPGGSTGWHFHDGTVYGLVREGTLTHYDSRCTVDGIYSPGSFVVETGGPGYVHLGRNPGSEPLVLDAVYVLPAGSPLAEDVPNPGCDFR
ncbi:cupin domain-containing protein [Nocardia transvalensis]|uniref:cupin domain-containing protein n=1 Tax=Nocardia transvalensis TaxID=37333 RepID=UPI00189354F9|nr:cupin domain-containing protein [Nocardia transvalensis]MBF6331979.1 cupin domain-containing protein [Nocardia transvalensis]